MFYGIIRVAVWSIAFIISLFFIRKSQVIHKRRWSMIVLAGAVVLTLISSFLPIENVFITFSSPASAYNYNHSENVKLIVEGQKTDLVVGVKGENTYVEAIVPKSNKGWKLGMPLDDKEIIHTVSDGLIIRVYQYKNTNDYYVTVLDISDVASDIADNRHSEFKYLEQSKRINNNVYYMYYAYVDSMDENYTLTVNGQSIKIQN